MLEDRLLIVSFRESGCFSLYALVVELGRGDPATRGQLDTLDRRM
jgi:hypothetical protein